MKMVSWFAIVHREDKSVLWRRERGGYDHDMKRSSLIIALGLMACSTLASFAAAPLLRYEFTQSGPSQASTGSAALNLTTTYRDGNPYNYVTAAPVLRSGATGPQALNFTAGNVNVSPDEGYGTANVTLNDTNAPFLRGDLESFTISLWMLGLRSDRSNVNPRLFGLRNAANTDILSLQFAPGTPNKLTLVLNGSEGQVVLKPTTVEVPVSDSQWYFLSVTYEATTGQVTFYGGLDGGTLLSESASNTVAGEVNTLLDNATLLAIAGLRSVDQRRASGYFSDVRFYDEALSAQEIQGIYSVPEPKGITLLGASLLVIGWSYWKKRRAC